MDDVTVKLSKDTIRRIKRGIKVVSLVFVFAGILDLFIRQFPPQSFITLFGVIGMAILMWPTFIVKSFVISFKASDLPKHNISDIPKHKVLGITIVTISYIMRKIFELNT